MTATVAAVSCSSSHSFSKTNQMSIRLLAGLGVDGDAHQGKTVQHLSRMTGQAEAPNLRQVHLLHAELLDDIRSMGFEVQPGDIGENITTRGLELLSLPRGTRLQLGETALVEVTGLRNPCVQLDRFQNGLMEAMLVRDARGRITERKSGVMSIVIADGEVCPGDGIRVELPDEPRLPLEPV